MALHPDLAPVVATLKERHQAQSDLELSARRAAYEELSREFWPEPDALGSVEDVTVPWTGGLRLRRYGPEHPDRGALLFFHGGSYVKGSLHSHDALCRRLANLFNWTVVAVDYRRAPEAPFPAAVDDAILAVDLVAGHLDHVAFDATTLVVAGDSVGAALASVAARHAGRERVAAQLLLYPSVGPSIITRSQHEYAGHALLDLDVLQIDYASYVGTADPTDPRVSLLMDLDLRGAPPAVIVVAECDPLRDEAVDLAGLFSHFDVPTTLLEAKGMVHGFLRLAGSIPAASAILPQIVSQVKSVVGAVE